LFAGEFSVVFGFFVVRLESSVSHFGRGIDELKVDFFGMDSSDLGEEGSSEHEDSFFGSYDASFNHEEIVSDHSVVGESSHGGDGLVGEILGGGSIVGASSSGSFTESVDLFVHFGSVMVSQLTGSGDIPSYSSRVPGSDTSDLSVTSMGFLLEMLNSESLNDSLESFTLGNSQNITIFVLLENAVDSHLLLEKVVSKVNFLGSSSSVNLNFDDVVFLLSKIEKFHLSGGDNSDDGAVLLDSVERDFDGLFFFGVFLLVLGEGLLFGADPVLVESSEGVFVEFLGPNGGKGSEASGGVDVSDDSDNNHRGAFDNGNGFNSLFFVEFGSGSFDVSKNVSHTGFEPSKSSEVAGLGSVILGERSASSSVMSGSSSGDKSKISVSGGFKFTVRHFRF